MKHKLISTLIFALLACSLAAASHYGFTSNGWEPSAINQAMGGSPVAAVNYWDFNALNAYSNPAFPSLHEGIGYDYADFVHMKYQTTQGTQRLYYHASLTEIGYRGIGLLTSFPAAFGTETDYGLLSVTDESGFEAEFMNPKDLAKVYGLSLDLRNLRQSNLLGLNPLPYNIDLALGVNLISNERMGIPLGKSQSTQSTDWGILLRMPMSKNSRIDQELALGVSLFNALNQTRECTFVNDQETIYQRLNIACGVSGELKNSGYGQAGMMGYIQHLASYKLLAGACEEFASDPMILGFGAELGIGDIFYLRSGYHHDEAGDISGLSYGLGARLQYRNLVSLSYDYASFPGSKAFEDKSIHNLGMDMDFMAIIRIIQARTSGKR